MKMKIMRISVKIAAELILGDSLIHDFRLLPPPTSFCAYARSKTFENGE
jgi:hypothetical protein